LSLFYKPRNLEELLQLRHDNPGAELISGGTDLCVRLHKTGQDPDLIDLTSICELKEISKDQDLITVGAGATFSEIIESETIQSYAPILACAAESIGSTQIRNRATIGGNLCNASPAADSPSALVVLEAKLNLVKIGSNGKETRQVSIEDFILAPGQTVLEPDEILLSIVFQVPQSFGYCYEKVGRRKSLAISRLSGSCLLKEKDGVIVDVRLSIGSVTNRPMRFSETEKLLLGKKLDKAVLDEAGEMSSMTVQKLTGIRESSAYKLPVVSNVTIRLIETAFDSAVCGEKK
jgi:Aerobic-type carbon monoxide dehydrogenase, middle subunit CoxM/CutM homologs